MFKLKHIRKYFSILIILIGSSHSRAQHSSKFIDSVRNLYLIPAIGYAVVKGDSIVKLEIIGQAKIDVNSKISTANRFHLGSNTKAITSLIASDLTKQRILNWNTSFFDIFPELKHSQASQNFTLFKLLNFEAPLTAFSYNTEIPDSIYAGKTGFEERYKIVQYLLKQPPVGQIENGLYLTNTGYVLAGLMMEKASGRNYQQLVDNLGLKLRINFQLGSPNRSDTDQTYGHDENDDPITQENIKLNWLMAAGNINISFADYAKFILFYLRATQGRSKFYSKQQMAYMLRNPNFSSGWFKEYDQETKNNLYHNFGNANGFMSSVLLFKEKGTAIFVLANKSSEKTEDGIKEIINRLKSEYVR